MFAAQISHLASLRLRLVAYVLLADIVRVEMSESSGAVAIGGDWKLVDVVNCFKFSQPPMSW